MKKLICWIDAELCFEVFLALVMLMRKNRESILYDQTWLKQCFEVIYNKDSIHECKRNARKSTVNVGGSAVFQMIIIKAISRPKLIHYSWCIMQILLINSSLIK